jgi:hypothetical protein
MFETLYWIFGGLFVVGLVFYVFLARCHVKQLKVQHPQDPSARSANR